MGGVCLILRGERRLSSNGCLPREPEGGQSGGRGAGESVEMKISGGGPISGLRAGQSPSTGEKQG